METDDSLERFEQYLQRRFPDRRTSIDYKSDMRQFRAVCTKAWREITMHDIDTFVDKQRAAGLSQATVKRRVAALKTLFDFLAEDSGDLNWPNPVRFKRHAGKLPRRLPRDLNDETVARVWNVITSPRDRAWFVLMWRAGLRVGEVVGLQLSDILTPPQSGRPAQLRVQGKGRKERIVLLSADAYDVLDAWLQKRPSCESSDVFLNERGYRLTPNGIEWLLHQYGEQADVRLTPHQLRHTYARQLVEVGMPITSLSRLMGHAHISTTQLYTSGADPALAQAYQTAMAQLAGSAQLKAEAPVVPVQPTTEPAPQSPTIVSVPPPLPDWSRWMPDLPPALRHASLDYAQRSLSTCQTKYQRRKALKVLSQFRRFWDWQQARRPITQLAELQLSDLHAYQAERLTQHITVATINRDVGCIVAMLRAQAERGQPVDNSIFRWRCSPCPDRLPRHLSEDNSQRLEAFFFGRLNSTDPLVRLENATFFVLFHTGLRVRECADLRVQDLDWLGGRLIVRAGKGQRDRVVYLSQTTQHALHLYLGALVSHPANPLWLHPNGQPISDYWLGRHIAALARAAGVPDVSPHRLRHTLATRLLNAGMDITRIQKLLGHEHINTTMIYARVQDVTVESDYHLAMRKIETQHMPLSDKPIAVANWPTQLAAMCDIQDVKEPPLDNSV